MLIVPNIPFIAKRKRGSASAEPPPPVALTLLSATYTTGIGSAALTLTFDREVNIDAYNGAEIVVRDGQIMGKYYNGTGGIEPHTAERVDITLEYLGEVTGSDILLTASAATGIVAEDDGGTWAGVTDLRLPYAT